MSKKQRASNPTEVGAYLRAVREDFGRKLDGEPWKQEDLAELLSVSKVTVSHWEQGVQLPKQRELDHLERCRVLVDLGYDPRKIRAESVEDLASRKADGSSRGFPLGRPRT
ncbi:MAG: helix-turn-helix domain-containing protein [Actinomycetota bacterium]|jgi:transcriptional regulator with XRE-family HTH domain|nr:helix-turn-helix domain-containing protein [Actinomycetota bacterium]